MRGNRRIALLIGAVLVVLSGCRRSDVFPRLTGPYLGQVLPEEGAELFAPGIVCSGMSERDVAMMPDGKEIYFGKVVSNNSVMAVMVTKLVDGRWSEPEVMDCCRDPRYRSLEPAISPDGQKFYFVSDRPDPEAGETEPGDWDIWVMDRVGAGWGEPVNLGAPVNSDEGEYFPSVTRDGTMYFTRGASVFRSRLEGGAYSAPEKLGPRVNCGRAQYNAFIDPDETYIIVPVFGRKENLGGTDYFIVYRDADDRWSEPVHLGAPMNSASAREWSAYVSPDRKVLFFMSDRMPEGGIAGGLDYRTLLEMHDEPRNGNPDIYWMSAEIIEALRPEGF